MTASASGRPRIPAAVERLLSPILLNCGFGIEVFPGESLPRWRSEAAFVRRKPNGEDIIRLGPMKFGKRLGLNIVRSRAAGRYEFMQWDKLGLTLDDLKYASHGDLETAVLRIVHFLQQQGFQWLDE